jgi:arylsulfatase A-like enzyme
MLGKTAKGPKRPGIILQTSRGALAFRQGDWKIRFPKATTWEGRKATLPTKGPELYNLSEDPGEQNNLSSRETERVSAMSTTLLDLLNRGRSH